MDDNIQSGIFGTPDIIVVRSLDVKCIFACRQIGIGYAVLIAHIYPLSFFVEAFEPNGILVLGGHSITEGRETDGDDVVAIREVELLDAVDIFWQQFRTYCNLGLRT